MAYVTSNTFSIRVNKTEVTQTPLNTQVIIYKGTNQLSAVSGTPGTNEYKVSITGTTNCSARLENDHKTITLTSVSSNNGQINISINVENVKTYTKTISVANITATSAIKNVSSRVQTVEQKLTKDGITTIVGDYYTTPTEVGATYATKSEVAQTAKDITYSFTQSPAINLIFNGDFTNNLSNWEVYKEGSGNWPYSSWDWLGWDCKIEGEIGCTKYIKQTVNFYKARIDDLTLSCKMYLSSGNNGSTNPFYYLYTETYYEDGTIWYANSCPTNLDTWETVVIKPHQYKDKRISTVSVYCYMRDTQRTAFFTDIMLTKGSVVYPYSKAAGEINSNTTKINGDGVNVIHSDGSRTNLNSSALNFYNSSNTLYAQVANGQYKFWNGSNYIGYLGHSAWSTDTSKRNISFAGEYGNTLTLSAKKTSSDTNYQTWLVVSGHEQTISDIDYHQGVILIQPRISGIMHFYGYGSMRDTTPGIIFASTDSHLAIMGDSYVDIGIQVGSSRYNGIRIDEAGGNPYTTINMYGNLNMNGWHITNTQSVNSLNATSAQTYALRTMSDEESYSDPTVKAITDIFPSQTPTEGEIRWTDRQTYFTSEVESGVYECYIEIPWWIAQNLELDYHVNITPTNGFYQYYVSERDPYYFTVRSDKDSMGFTFEIVCKLLDNNTIANNASIAGDQYLASDLKEPEAANIVTELDTADIITTDTTSGI